jgi:hypothetical protein
MRMLLFFRSIWCFYHLSHLLLRGWQGLNSQVRPNAGRRCVVDVWEVDMTCDTASSVRSFVSYDRSARLFNQSDGFFVGRHLAAYRAQNPTLASTCNLPNCCSPTILTGVLPTKCLPLFPR